MIKSGLLFIMNKSELIEQLNTKQTSLSTHDVKLAIDSILDIMAKTLAENDRIEVRGFGTFSVRHREARIARNPKTNEIVSVSERNAVHFKPGKVLKCLVNK